MMIILYSVYCYFFAEKKQTTNITKYIYHSNSWTPIEILTRLNFARLQNRSRKSFLASLSLSSRLFLPLNPLHTTGKTVRGNHHHHTPEKISLLNCEMYQRRRVSRVANTTDFQNTRTGNSQSMGQNEQAIYFVFELILFVLITF